MNNKLKETIKQVKDKIEKYAPETLDGKKIITFIDCIFKNRKA